MLKTCSVLLRAALFSATQARPLRSEKKKKSRLKKSRGLVLSLLKKNQVKILWESGRQFPWPFQLRLVGTWYRIFGPSEIDGLNVT